MDSTVFGSAESSLWKRISPIESQKKVNFSSLNPVKGGVLRVGEAQYTDLEEIVKTPFANVWGAKGPKGKRVVIKIVVREKVVALQREHRLLTRVWGEQFSSFDQASGALIIERADFDLFDAVINQRLGSSQKEEMVFEIWRQLCLIHAKGLAHGDIKPESIVCWIKKKGIRIQVIDFDKAQEDEHYVLSGTNFYINGADWEKMRRPITVGERRGMDCFAAAITCLCVISEYSPIMGLFEGNEFNTGESPCRLEHFTKGIGENVPLWNVLTEARTDNLETQMQKGSFYYFQQVTQALGKEPIVKM